LNDQRGRIALVFTVIGPAADGSLQSPRTGSGTGPPARWYAFSVDTAVDRGKEGEPAPREAADGEVTPRLTKTQVVTACALIALVLHTLAVLWTWFAWSGNPGTRGWWLVFTDLPVSFLYGHATHSSLLVWSLLLGGLQWAVTGALVALAVWHFAAFRKRRS